MKEYNKKELAEVVGITQQTANNWIRNLGNGTTLAEKDLIEYVVNMPENRLDYKLKYLEELIRHGVVTKIKDNPKTITTDYHPMPIIPLKKYAVLSLIYGIDRMVGEESAAVKINGILKDKAIEDYIYFNDHKLKEVVKEYNCSRYFNRALLDILLKKCEKEGISINEVNTYLKVKMKMEKEKDETCEKEGECKVEYKRYMTGKELIEFFNQELLPNEFYNAEYIMYEIGKMHMKIESVRRRNIYPYICIPIDYYNMNRGIHRLAPKNINNIFNDLKEEFERLSFNIAHNQGISFKQYDPNKYIKETIYLPSIIPVGVRVRYVYYTEIEGSENVIERHIIDIIDGSNYPIHDTIKNYYTDLIRVVE